MTAVSSITMKRGLLSYTNSERHHKKEGGGGGGALALIY